MRDCDLKDRTRRELQDLAKENGIKANIKSEEIVRQLKRPRYENPDKVICARPVAESAHTNDISSWNGLEDKRAYLVAIAKYLHSLGDAEIARYYLHEEPNVIEQSYSDIINCANDLIAHGLNENFIEKEFNDILKPQFYIEIDDIIDATS